MTSLALPPWRSWHRGQRNLYLDRLGNLHARPGQLTNTINTTDITDNEGRTLTTPITANLNVSNLQISKAFYPPTINQNGLSTLTITLTNTNTSPLTGLSVSDTLPGGVIVAPVSVPPGEPYANTDCGGTLTATPSSGSITLTGGSVPAQVGVITGKCTINVDVKGTGAAGTYTNTLRIAPEDISALPRRNANLSRCRGFSQLGHSAAYHHGQ